MGRETIYEIACEMLESTNIFRNNVAEISYRRNAHEEISLLDLVKKATRKFDHRYHGKTEDNLHRAYMAIAEAMVRYVEDYPVVFSFKQRTKQNFAEWLDKIAKEKCSRKEDIPEELTRLEWDTGVAMLKLLHSRKGISYEQLEKELSIKERAIQKDLVKLSPSLYAGNKEAYAPLRLGGQPLLAKISLVEETEKAAEKLFYTPNTVHPIVLQENVMQLATLLKSLANQYYEKHDDVARLIAMDIWSQISEYAQDKMKKYFAFDDQNLGDFIVELQDDSPVDRMCKYHTEKEMLDQQIELSVEQALEFLMKADGRTGRILFKTGNCIWVDHLEGEKCVNGKRSYIVKDKQSNVTSFTKEEVEEIILDK